jgi:hypothetical protein
MPLTYKPSHDHAAPTVAASVATAPRQIGVRPSLMRFGLLTRLAMAAVAVAAIWTLVILTWS